MSDTYYVIGKADKRGPNEPHSNAWPKLVAYSFTLKRILLLEGYGHGLMGGSIALSSFNPTDWEEIFIETGSTWFKKSIADGSLNNLSCESDFESALSKNGCQIDKMVY